VIEHGSRLAKRQNGCTPLAPEALNDACGRTAAGERIEQLTVNAWPGLREFVHNGWLIRLSDGFTKRANSVQPLWSGAGADGDIREKIGYCEEIYRNAGLTALFKITPFAAPANLDRLLHAYGYDRIEPSSVRTVPLSGLARPASDGIEIERRLSGRWLSLVADWLRYSDEQASAAERIMNAGPDAKAFFTLLHKSEPVACGMGVIEDGYVGLYEIVTRPDCRNRGFGKQLLLHILHWGAGNGAHTGYLQVADSNASAIRLYDKLGFKKVYAYWYRRRGCG
jgi:GNAT superfamily N-acetyltransferase